MPTRTRARKSKTRVAAAVPVQAPTPQVSARVRQWCALGVFLAVLVVYLCTIQSTVVSRKDNGEMLSAAHVLGIVHPTGYPLWTLLARLFDGLPVGHTSAFRMALLSAVSLAAAAAIVTWLTMTLSGSLLSGPFAGLAFAFWLPTWNQAVVAESYGLQALLVALFLLALWRWEGARTPPGLGWVALAAGFAASNHRTGFLIVTPALPFVFWLTRFRRTKERIRGWLKALLLLAAPFLFYLYLPIRAAAHPLQNWGDPETWDRFLDHVLARQYQGYVFLNFRNDFSGAAKSAVLLLHDSLAKPGWPSWLFAAIGLVFVLWGLVSWLRRHPAVIGPLALGCVVIVVFTVGYGADSDNSVYLIPAGAVAALLAGLGIARLEAKAPRRAAGQFAVAALAAAVCMLLLSANWSRADQHNTWRYRDQMAAELSQMDRNAIFVADMDLPMFCSYYLQEVEGLRGDITLLPPHQLWQSWYPKALPDRELRETSLKLWNQLTNDYHLTAADGEDFWQAVSVFAARLAEHYRGRRTVYAVHTPFTPLPGPPYFTGVSRDLVRLDFEEPQVLRAAARPAPPAASFAGGVNLVSLELGGKGARPGDLVSFRARWRLDSSLAGSLFAIRFRPVRASLSETAMESSGFTQEYAPIYGLFGLAASPPGTVYEQDGKLIVPSNAPPGEYTLQVGYAIQYRPPQYEGWREVPTRLVVRD